MNEIQESEIQESLEWRSVLRAVVGVKLRSVLTSLDQAGTVAYTDGACIKNPGGPAGWSALLWNASDMHDGQLSKDAPCFECYGHIPKASTTTNNRAEISAVLAVLSLAPPTLPLVIYSDSEYTIHVARGKFKMKANPDLWAVYRQLLSYRREAPRFTWVQGHAGHLQNERADRLAGLGAWNNDLSAFERWQASQAPEARSGLSNADLQRLRQYAQRLQDFFKTIALDSARVSAQERQFIDDIARRLQKNTFAPSEKQSAWLKRLASKFNV